MRTAFLVLLVMVCSFVILWAIGDRPKFEDKDDKVHDDVDTVLKEAAKGEAGRKTTSSSDPTL